MDPLNSPEAGTKRRTTIDRRQKKERELLLAELRKTSIVAIACQKTGVSRATFYRWMEDPEFSQEVALAQGEGRDAMNDAAESVLAKKIKEENLHAVKFWLTHNNERYRPGSSKTQINNFPRKQIEEIQEMWKFLFDKVRGKKG